MALIVFLSFEWFCSLKTHSWNEERSSLSCPAMSTIGASVSLWVNKTTTARTRRLPSWVMNTLCELGQYGD